ncbi:MAG: hypothetical protein KF819_17005 [Labilithrix sp.]|nr:hypothetical protein [Labilithrix sp.]
MSADSRRLAAGALALVIIVFCAAWAARASEGRRAIAEADAAIARGEPFDAIMAARAAAEARCPLCASPEGGFARLERIAKDAEKRGDDATAFAAWRAVRAASLATVIGSRRSERRLRAEGEIARFAHRLDVAAVAGGATPTAAAAEDKMRATLADDEIPSGATFALIGLGGIVFFAGALRFLAKKQRAELGVAAIGAATSAAAAIFF